MAVHLFGIHCKCHCALAATGLEFKWGKTDDVVSGVLLMFCFKHFQASAFIKRLRGRIAKG